MFLSFVTVHFHFSFIRLSYIKKRIIFYFDATSLIIYTDQKHGIYSKKAFVLSYFFLIHGYSVLAGNNQPKIFNQAKLNMIVYNYD